VEDQVYAYARVGPQQQIVVALNNLAQARDVTVDLAPLAIGPGAQLEPRLGGAPARAGADQRVVLRLLPRSGAVWEVVE
jgi:hypothetical protein